MLTYNFENRDVPIYEYIYRCIKEDIISGKLKPGEKLPSKRTFADNNGISIITIQNAYEQLISEGYVYTLPKKGYYVAAIEGMGTKGESEAAVCDIELPKKKEYLCDLSGNGIETENFPFSVWTRLSREVMNDRKRELLEISPSSGVRELREAIAAHLQSFRGMTVNPDQIVVGAGTEYLYGLITELLGNGRVYAIENPGYKKLLDIYRQRGVLCRTVDMDGMGVTVEGLLKSGADVAHICPNHHFPTGITMPASRRYEVLSWADNGERYILEDDYDSEFRQVGRPVPTLFSIDTHGKVIYMNTFSKSLSPTIRVSYMVLPGTLANRFYREMSFYSCTVSNFEQYTLARFISGGYFEKHINRCRLYYNRKRARIIKLIECSALGSLCEIQDNDAGLHFIVKVRTGLSDREIESKLGAKGIKIRALSDYYIGGSASDQHRFIINYSSVDEKKIARALDELKKP